MYEWALPTIAVLLIGYGAVSGLWVTVITQARMFVALGLLVGNRVLDLVDVEVANQFVRHLAELGHFAERHCARHKHRRK